MPVTPSREFWIHVLESKIQGTIRNRGDMIGWEDDDERVGPVALAAKQSLLRAIPYMMLKEGTGFYRLVVDHGDYGIHNTSINIDVNGYPLITCWKGYSSPVVRITRLAWGWLRGILRPS